MAYCTQSDIEKMLPERQLIRLTDDENIGVINTARLDEAMDSAAEEIDAYIGSRTKLPVSGTAPPVLGKFNTDIAIYNLYSRFSENIPETRAERYKNAIKTLQKISEGKLSFGLQPLPDPPDETGYAAAVQSSARDKMFGSKTMDKY